jgi:hypothetical protein
MAAAFGAASFPYNLWSFKRVTENENLILAALARIEKLLNLLLAQHKFTDMEKR